MKTYSLFTTLTTMHEVAHAYPPIQQRLLYGGGEISQTPFPPKYTVEYKLATRSMSYTLIENIL